MAVDEWMQHKPKQSRGNPLDCPTSPVPPLTFKCNSWFWKNAFYISYCWGQGCCLLVSFRFCFVLFSIFLNLYFWWKLARGWFLRPMREAPEKAVQCRHLPAVLFLVTWVVASSFHGPNSDSGESCRKEDARKLWWLKSRPRTHVTRDKTVQTQKMSWTHFLN